MKKIIAASLLLATGLTFANNFPAALQMRPVSDKIFVNPMLGPGEGAGDSNVGLAFGAAVGYRFNSLIMAEFDAIRTPRGSDSSLLMAIGPRFTATFNNTWSAYAKIGLGVVYNSGDDSYSRFGTMLGLGAKMAINASWGLNAEVSGSLGSDANTYAILFGPYFRF